jgi:hypothetical protein
MYGITANNVLSSSSERKIDTLVFPTELCDLGTPRSESLGTTDVGM